MYIGYDRRFASEDFAAAAAEVIAGNGIKVLLSPTPFLRLLFLSVLSAKRPGVELPSLPATTRKNGMVSNSVKQPVKAPRQKLPPELKNTLTLLSARIK